MDKELSDDEKRDNESHKIAMALVLSGGHYVAPTDPKIQAGRKLRDMLIDIDIAAKHAELLERDKQYRDSSAKFEEAKRKIQAAIGQLANQMSAPLPELVLDIRPMPDSEFNIDSRHDWHGIRICTPPETPPSIIKTVGRIVMRIVVGVALVGILAIGIYFRFPEVQRWFQ